jgi:hypothetical protein
MCSPGPEAWPGYAWNTLPLSSHRILDIKNILREGDTLLCTGGVSYTFYIPLLISELFYTRGCMGGWGGGVGSFTK